MRHEGKQGEVLDQTFRRSFQSSLSSFDRWVLPLSGDGMHLVGLGFRTSGVLVAGKDGWRRKVGRIL